MEIYDLLDFENMSNSIGDDVDLELGRQKEALKLGLSSDADWDEICNALVKKRPS